MPSGSKRVADTASGAIRILWEEGFFKDWSNTKKASTYLSERGNHFSLEALRMSLVRARFLTRQRGKDGAFEYVQKKNASSQKLEEIENQLFSEDLLQKLDKNFTKELDDLQLNFGRSGNCSAFLLRKILEKLIYIAFAHNNIETKLEDKNQPSGLKGLQSMINVAASEKVNGFPFITPKTAQEIKGIKFLGDSSAHNPLIDVDMETIIPQMPFIITAYKELVRHL